MREPVSKTMRLKGRDRVPKLTTVKLELSFWDFLRGAAAEEQISLTRMVDRIKAESPPTNLSSSIRVWCLARATGVKEPAAEVSQ